MVAEHAARGEPFKWADRKGVLERKRPTTKDEEAGYGSAEEKFSSSEPDSPVQCGFPGTESRPHGHGLSGIDEILKTAEESTGEVQESRSDVETNTSDEEGSTSDVEGSTSDGEKK